MLGFKQDNRGDYYTACLLGFKYSRYANGSTYLEIPSWFKAILFVTAFMTVITVAVIAWDITQRNKCGDYGLQTAQPIKYSGSSGCYQMIHGRWKRVYL